MAIISFSSEPATFALRQIIPEQRFQALSGERYTNALAGARWGLRLEFSQLSGAKRRTLWSEIGQLNGSQHSLRVTFGNSIGYSRSGDASGTALVKGAVSIGASKLTIDGFTGSIGEGDFLSIGNQLFLALGSVISGDELSVWPVVRKPIANDATVVYTAPQGVFLLADEPPELAVVSQTKTDWVSSLTLDLEEDILA